MFLSSTISKIAIGIIIYLFSSSVLAQVQRSDLISGKLLDIYSNEPIRNAQIRILSDSVYSDQNGNFSYYFKKRTTSVSLEIRHATYKSETISNWNTDSILLLRMIPKKQLENVIVTFGARSLIDSLRANIYANNLLSAHSLDGFYRTYKIVNDTVFFEQNDALLRMFIANPQSNIPKSFQVLGWNVYSKDFSDSVLKAQIGNQLNWVGTYSILNDMDFVRSKNFLTDSDIGDSFSFVYKGKKHENGRCSYIVGFKIKDNRKPNMEGSIFIDSSSYALQGLTYFLNEKAREKMNKKNHAKDFFGFYQIFYQISDDNKWSIRNIHIEANGYKEFNDRKYQTNLYLDFVTLKINKDILFSNAPEKSLILIKKNSKEVIPEKVSYPDITDKKNILDRIKDFITNKQVPLLLNK